MSLIRPGNRTLIRSRHVTGIVDLISGVSGSHTQPVSFTQLNDSGNYSLTLRALDTVNGKAFQVLSPASAAVQVMSVNKNGLAVGAVPCPAGNMFVVSNSASLTAGQMVSFEMNNIGGSAGDVSNLRVVMREMTAADNQSHAAEIHGLWSSGTGAYQRSAITVSAQASVPSATGTEHNMVRMLSVPAAWLMSSPDPIDNALVLQAGDGVVTNFGTAYNTSGVMTWQANAINGTMKSGHHYPLADATYDLGNASGPVIWRTVYAHGFVFGNGSAANPSWVMLNDLTTGFFRAATDTLGYSINGSQVLQITSGGKLNFTGGQQVNLGGGAGATLGTIGGSGPATAAQAAWLGFQYNGTNYWLPVWA